MPALFNTPVCKMPFNIKRDFSPDYKSLLTRPRVSYRISEYVFDFINQHLLKPNRLLQSEKYIYVFTFSFAFSIPSRKFPYTSPFSTATRLFFPQNGFRTVQKMERWATLGVVADDIDETITPYEYANVVFNMFADFLLYNYKKLDKTHFEQLRQKLDRKYIESFPFPASFDEQQYSLDDIEYPIKPGDQFLTEERTWVSVDKWVTMNPKTEYLKHYPE